MRISSSFHPHPSTAQCILNERLLPIVIALTSIGDAYECDHSIGAVFQRVFDAPNLPKAVVMMFLQICEKVIAAESTPSSIGLFNPQDTEYACQLITINSDLGCHSRQRAS
jgi:hypothetical protein